MLTEIEEMLDALKRARVIITDTHCIDFQGRHSGVFVNKDALYMHPLTVNLLSRMLALKFLPDNVDCIIAPTITDIVLAQWVAYHMCRLTRRAVSCTFAEKTTLGSFNMRRTYAAALAGKNVLVIEDTLNTGNSAKLIVELAHEMGAKNIIGVGALFNMGAVNNENVGNVKKLCTLLDLSDKSWEADKCPICAKGLALNEKLMWPRALVGYNAQWLGE